jgi:hypothetical protein
MLTKNKDGSFILEIIESDFIGAKRAQIDSCPATNALLRSGSVVDGTFVGKYTCMFQYGDHTLDRILDNELRKAIDKYDRTGKKFTGKFKLITP